jgi:hypothetical protein
MQCNVGGVDRQLRFASGAALLFAGGAIAGTTAYTRYCPLNAAPGIDTCG